MKNFSKILELCDQLSGFEAATAAALRAETAAGERAKSVMARTDPADGKALARLRDARSEAEFATLRRQKAQNEAADARRKLEEDFRDLAGSWDTFVLAKRDVVRPQFFAAITPFWPSADACHRELHHLFIPLWHELNRLLVNDLPGEKTADWQLVQMTQGLVNKIEAACKHYGWAFPAK